MQIRIPCLPILITFLCNTALAAGPSPSPSPSAEPAVTEPLFAYTTPVDIAGKSDFINPQTLNDDAATQLQGLCSLNDFRALPETDRHVYTFDAWPGAGEKLGKKTYTFNFHLGPKGVTSEKIALIPIGGGPNSNVSFIRAKNATGSQYVLQGLGNLDWSGIAQHTFKFDKPVSAFGVVLNSSADIDVKKFYWAAAKERNGYPVSYTLTDGTIVQLGQRDLRGAILKGGTNSFLGVIDHSGRGIVSVNYALKGLAGNKAQSIEISAIAFATMPKPAVSQVINLRSSCDFESADSITPAPAPALAGLSPLEDFRFIVANKRYVYRFDTWPKNEKNPGTGEFAFDLRGKGDVDQKVKIHAENSSTPSGSQGLEQVELKNEDSLPYPVLGGLGNISKGKWSSQTFQFEKPVRAFGVTYRCAQNTMLAQTPGDAQSYPVSYKLSDGTVVNLGGANTPASLISKGGKTFVGVIDKTDKGIVSATVRIQGTDNPAQPLYIEDLAFALPGPPPGNWKLVLEDNFDGNKLNPDIWAPGYTFKDVINSEMQGFVPENITVANGVCTIKVEKRDCFNMDRDGNKGPAQKFASGAFTSFGKFTPTYGYFEARIKMPHYRGAGIWPAFWMLPDRGKDYPKKIRNTYRTKDYGTGIEIDIFEFMPRWKRTDGLFPIHVGCIWSYGKVTETDPAPHGYGSYALGNDGWGPGELNFPNLDDEFHTYGLYWSPERLIYYVDSKPIFRVKDPKHVPDVPHYFLFNISISGNGWGKSPDKSNPTMEQIIGDMPNEMQIDYFRAYSGTLDEAIPAAPTDDPSIIRKYTPPSKDEEATPQAPVPATSASPKPTDGAPAAPVNSTIVSPSNG